jgi:transposase-like protein
MSRSVSGRYSREFMLKAIERLEAGERASALAIEWNLNRTIVYHWRDRLRAPI